MQKNALSKLNAAGRRLFDGVFGLQLLTTIIMLLLLGAGLRFLDFTEPPLDFHPTRQMRGALIARDFYYQWNPDASQEIKELAHQLAQTEPTYEPPILEAMAAIGYRLIGGEELWVGRLLSILFWLGGAAPLFLLARRLTSASGALLSLGYYLLLPLGVELSRSFQPDAMMISFLILFTYCLYRWSEELSWSWAIPVGLFAGLTILIKGRPAPMVGLIAMFTVLGRLGFINAIKSAQVWTIAVLSLLIPGFYYLGPLGPNTVGLVSTYSSGLMDLLRQPWFYVRWLDFVDGHFNLALVFVGAASIALLKPKGRWLLAGWLAGYVAYGFALPYTIYTHDYYSAPLIPLVALSLGPLGSKFWKKLTNQPYIWRVIAIAVIAAGVFRVAWSIRSGILGTDYYSEPIGWHKMGRELPQDGSIIALTHDYGARIAYYGWRRVSVWPSGQDYEFYALQGHNRAGDIEEEFIQRTRNDEYFLVTLLGEFERQEGLKQILTQEYELLIDGDGYLLFDLQSE